MSNTDKRSSKENIGSTDILWENIEDGYHVNTSGSRIDVCLIGRNYAKVLRKWYSNIPLTEEDEIRVKTSRMFINLEDVINNSETDQYNKNIGDEKQ